MAAALRVLSKDGPELPMDAVAAEAGVTKPVLYRYFVGKAAPGWIRGPPSRGRSASPAWCRAPGNGGWTGGR